MSPLIRTSPMAYPLFARRRITQFMNLRSYDLDIRESERLEDRPRPTESRGRRVE